MTDEDVKKLRGVIREEVTAVVEEKVGAIVEEKLKPIGDRLGKVEKKLDILWEQVEKVTFSINDTNETLGTHTDALKRIEAKVENNSNDIHRLNKRVVVLESRNGIVSPPELTI